jgi:hypothetical protein
MPRRLSKREASALQAFLPVRDRHIIVPPVPRRLNNHVRNAHVPQALGEGPGLRSCDVIDVDLGVRARASPAPPESVVATIIGAVEPPTLAKLCQSSILASGQLPHRPAAAAMACEDEIAQGGSHPRRTVWRIRAQGGKNLAQEGVETTGLEQASGFRARAERRRDKNHIAPARVDAFAQRAIGKRRLFQY